MLFDNSPGVKRGAPAGREELCNDPPEGSRSQTLPCHKALQKEGKKGKKTQTQTERQKTRKLKLSVWFVTLMPIFFTEYRIQSRHHGEIHAMLYFLDFLYDTTAPGPWYE